MFVELLIWGTRGDPFARRVLCGTVKVKRGLKTIASLQGVSRVDNVCNEALRVIGLYEPGDKVSLFLKDWELARVALSCRMALDMLCQEMHEA